MPPSAVSVRARQVGQRAGEAVEFRSDGVALAARREWLHDSIPDSVGAFEDEDAGVLAGRTFWFLGGQLLHAAGIPFGQMSRSRLRGLGLSTSWRMRFAMSIRYATGLSAISIAATE